MTPAAETFRSVTPTGRDHLATANEEVVAFGSHAALWQLVDSAFPTGGFAHSGGLEAAAQTGELSAATLPLFLRTSLRQQARGLLPFALQALGEPGDFFAICRRCDAFLTNHVARAASSRQGKALLSSAASIFQYRLLRSLNDELRSVAASEDRIACHQAPAFGAVASCLGLSRGACARGYLFVTLRDQVSSAIRLGVVGPMEGHGALHSLAPDLESLSEEALAVRDFEAFQTAPLIDIVQTSHHRLYSRLFQS